MKPVLIDREEAAKVAETRWATLSIGKVSFDRQCEIERGAIAGSIRALPPYTTAPARPAAMIDEAGGEVVAAKLEEMRACENGMCIHCIDLLLELQSMVAILNTRVSKPAAPTTEAQKQAQKILWEFMGTISGDGDYSCAECELDTYLCPHLFDRLQNLIAAALPSTPGDDARARAREIYQGWRSDHNNGTAALYTTSPEIDDLVARIAAALSSTPLECPAIHFPVTPSVAECVAEVKRLRDAWARLADEYYERYHSTYLNGKRDGANEIITALEALQPSTPSEPKGE